MSTFQDASAIYENIKVSKLVKNQIASRAIGEVMRWSSRLFQILDRSDPLQADISRRLWVLRSTILFTLLPFGDPVLAIRQQMTDLARASTGLPDAAPTIESLGKAIEDVLSSDSNPKLDWLLRMLEAHSGVEQSKVGFLIRLSAGSAPGWPPDVATRLPEIAQHITFINSRADLRSGLFGKIILPCACRNTAPALLEEIIHSGRARTVDVLMYPEEKFNVSRRLSLPDCGLFKGRIQKTKIEQETAEVSDTSISVDTWINEAFWQGIHGGERSAAANLVSANYVLFSDGTGTFFPANGHVPVLPSTGSLRDESDLRFANVGNLSEGDLVVMRVGDSNFLLDETSDRLMQNDLGDNLVVDATDWKDALDALLITHSCDEVSQLLSERGVRVSAASIHQWAGPDVLGPGSQKVFAALIELLGARGKIALAGDALHQYSELKWKSLQNLRSVRQRAGNMIRHELLQKLVERFHDGIGNLGNRTAVQIEGETGTELLVLKVSSADQKLSFVQPSMLGRLDDHRGNPWLG
jgi:hypothetical protein